MRTINVDLEDADELKPFDLARLTAEARELCPEIEAFTARQQDGRTLEMLVHCKDAADGRAVADATLAALRAHVPPRRMTVRKALAAATPKQRAEIIEAVILRHFGDIVIDG